MIVAGVFNLLLGERTEYQWLYQALIEEENMCGLEVPVIKPLKGNYFIMLKGVFEFEFLFYGDRDSSPELLFVKNFTLIVLACCEIFKSVYDDFLILLNPSPYKLLYLYQLLETFGA